MNSPKDVTDQTIEAAPNPEEDQYTLYAQRRTEREKQYEQYLELFRKSMEGKLSEKVIRNHLSNIDLFLNSYLIDYSDYEYSDSMSGPAPMEEGMGSIVDFLGYFLIRKCMWSTPSTIKSTAASIKKFYKCMLDNEQFGDMTREDFQAEYEDMLEHIKYSMEDWQADCAQYNDPDQPNPFAMW